NFAAYAICYTDAPSTIAAFVRQRLRWERDAVRLRYRKHRDILNPFSNRFRLSELAHELEFLFFNVMGAFILPVYLFWLFATYGGLAPVIVLAAQFGLFFLELAAFSLAAWAMPKAATLSLATFLPGYSLFNGVFVRFVRLFAYIQEWIFLESYKDAYVPSKVHRVRT
ncbi:MAG: glycosyltransferase family 2 protein, partial [Pseudomonadota bacterium]